MGMLKYSIGGRLMPGWCSAIVLDGEDPGTALVEDVVQAIGTDVLVTAGGVTLHLAAWEDPAHWSEEWREKGIEEPYEFIAGLVRSDG
jgi:hypothetical protein